MRKKTKQEINTILEELKIMHPTAGCELHYRTSFELLVAVILSAQCTDKRVNLCTDKMFLEVNTPSGFASMTVDELSKYIFSCGFYNNKGKNIIAMSKELLEKYDGEVPVDFDKLVSLAGVGRKTASVVLSVAFDIPAMPVDTHVNRVSLRLGLSKGKNVEIVEKDLMKCIPKDRWNEFHHSMIFHGRYTCHAGKPKCQECRIKDYCEYYRSKGEK